MSTKTETHRSSIQRRGETHKGLLSISDHRAIQRRADAATATQAVLELLDRRLQSSFGGPDGVPSASGFGEPDQLHLMSSFGGADRVRSASTLGRPDEAHLTSSFGGPDGVLSASTLGRPDYV